MSLALIWFRQDLRIHDNPALDYAASKGLKILPLYILDENDPWAPGGASRWWLHHSLTSLNKSLEGQLVLRRGDPLSLLKEIVKETGAATILWNRCYEPYAIQRDTTIKAWAQNQGIHVESFKANLLVEPWEIKTQQDKPYQVFTPFWKALQARGLPPLPLEAPHPAWAPTIPSDDLESWGLHPDKPDWSHGFEWTPGEEGAAQNLETFLDEGLEGYKANRNLPYLKSSTSKLSPHLHWGEISPRQIWHTIVEHQIKNRDSMGEDALCFLSEIAWREFSYNLLYHVPTLPSHPLKTQFEKFPWRDDDAGFHAWTQGMTGYPIVDAGMRQLWQTGWMHNRVRMIVASFLIKDLLIPWQKGEAWFWDTLVDADLSSNAASWQWVAGSGADASPYFRIFNPTTQGETYDPRGEYIRTFVPELTGLPDAYIHKPWQAPPLILKEAGVVLGETYPHPIVDHGKARLRALEALQETKS